MKIPRVLGIRRRFDLGNAARRWDARCADPARARRLPTDDAQLRWTRLVVRCRPACQSRDRARSAHLLPITGSMLLDPSPPSDSISSTDLDSTSFHSSLVARATPPFPSSPDPTLLPAAFTHGSPPQVRSTAKVTKAVALGDLSNQIEVDASRN
ncbi:hypothetical protein DFP72DRAFT_1082050 [Ephemerocybe angulata]|uniref:Uncharacterized protein n=1 Tax=Ephemerocybe angulata TaxID=980116 RepID=A0A8H6H8H4_9AGAR|nr:hypothetical protein DFP72DRAFT_1082050 [Tulosesus angulatus]